MDPVVIYLAGPPMGKERVRVRRDGSGVYTPDRTVRYESRVAYAAQQAMAGRALLEGPLEVAIVARMPVAESKPVKWKAAALAGDIRPTKKPDADNIAKMLDALNLIVWTDDAQVVSLHVEKIYAASPSLNVTIRPANLGVFL